MIRLRYLYRALYDLKRSVILYVHQIDSNNNIILETLTKFRLKFSPIFAVRAWRYVYIYL